jgi:alkyl hydroperoxide reductase subunit AhpC
MTYPMNVGRNFAEVLRALDGLQTANGRGVATPADWQVGQDVVIPATVKDDAAREKFGEFTTVFPYLRTVQLKS